jgi:ERCC4-related helicase
LVATSVLAEGLDVAECDMVVLFEMTLSLMKCG